MRALLTLLAAAAAVPGPLRQLEGHRRVLVLIAPDAGSPQLAAQDRLLAVGRAGLAERDVATVRVVGARVSGASDAATALRDRLGVGRHAFAVRLIGKDGHVALRDTNPVAAATLFATIDAMPMRRAEVARRGH